MSELTGSAGRGSPEHRPDPRRPGDLVVGAVVEPVDEVELRLRRLDPQLPLPAYAHPGDAGLDLHAAAEVTLEPGRRALVPTGLSVAIPDGHVGLVHPRSGLAARHGVTVLNAPGTVDAGYRGEILVNLVNLDPDEPFVVRRGDRIAQLLLQRVSRARLVEADVLSGTSRGQTGHGDSGGFGRAER